MNVAKARVICPGCGRSAANQANQNKHFAAMHGLACVPIDAAERPPNPAKQGRHHKVRVPGSK